MLCFVVALFLPFCSHEHASLWDPWTPDVGYGQGCLVSDTIASAGFVVADRGCENAWPGQRIIANCLNYNSFPERRCENAWPGQRIV